MLFKILSFIYLPWDTWYLPMFLILFAFISTVCIIRVISKLRYDFKGILRL